MVQSRTASGAGTQKNMERPPAKPTTRLFQSANCTPAQIEQKRCLESGMACGCAVSVSCLALAVHIRLRFNDLKNQAPMLRHVVTRRDAHFSRGSPFDLPEP